MSVRNIVGLLSITPDATRPANKIVQEGNVSFKHVSQRRSIYYWDNNNAGSTKAAIALQPFKNAYMLLDDDDAVGHGLFFNGATLAGSAVYPFDNLTGAGSFATMTTIDYSRFRVSGSYGTAASTTIPRVLGCVAAFDNVAAAYNNYYGSWGSGDAFISMNDVPLDYTQIGIVYGHPATWNTTLTCGTSVGLNYITFTNASLLDQLYNHPLSYGAIRLTSGSDQGIYFVQLVDFTNNRMYLRTPNGTPFVASATNASVTTELYAPRRAFFNESLIIPLSVGAVDTSGRFAPKAASGRDIRSSFIVRLYIDKTGSDETAAAAEQQGTYLLGLRPFSHGDGVDDHNNGLEYGLGPAAATITLVPPAFAFFDGGASAMVLNEEDDRAWVGYTNASQQSGLLHWRWRTNEEFREVANYLGTPGHNVAGSFLSPVPSLGTGDVFRHASIGSDKVCYFAIYHATLGNGGLLAINPNRTTYQYTAAGVFPNSQVAGLVVDRSRYRSFTNITTTAASNTITDNAGNTFTNADIGRCIKITSGLDVGNYLVASVSAPNIVVVTDMAGGAVSFAGSIGDTAQIGDRIYFFFNNGTTGSGKINYMESLVPGTFLTRTVTMTNGANTNVYAKSGERQKITINQATGEVFWLSNDTQQQINKYDPLANSHSFIPISDASLLSPSGGTPANPGTPTVFTAILANSKFDELWVGSDAGHFKIVRSTFPTTTTAKRYYGNESTTYQNPAGSPRSAGSYSAYNTSNYVRTYFERPDGRVLTILADASHTHTARSTYSRESDSFFIQSDVSIGVNNVITNQVTDQSGWNFEMRPGVTASTATKFDLIGQEVHYQWDNANAKWIPLEWERKGLPNKSVSDASAPRCNGRPIHSTFQDAVYGVKVRFTKQGGATPSNNEFLGRAGQTRVTASDGATTTGSANFDGSGFVAGDVGKLLRIESGADAGIYKIATYVNAGRVTLANLSGLTAFSATATAGTLTYTVWTTGSVGSNAGPETFSFMLADGIGKDNTQDLTGVTYESFIFKTRLHEWDEGRKFCVENPLAVPGSVASKVYFENYPRSATITTFDPSSSHHKALPGAETTNGRQALDWLLDKYLDGSGSKGTLYSGSPWNGRNTGTNTTTGAIGYSMMVDFGVDVEVGYVQVRLHSYASAEWGGFFTITDNGLLANLYKASGAAPADSSVARTSGTSNLNISGANVQTATLSSGDFLGAIRGGGGPFANGAIVAGQSTFTDTTNAPFVSADVGRILKITAGAGADISSYRIIGFTSSSVITVRNLDQTTKQWAVSASGVTYEVRDGVREEDMICIPTIASPTQKLVVERLTSPTSADLRIGPTATITSQSWQAAVPTWDLVKRISYSTDAQPPEVKNNGTWVGLDGREQYDQKDGKIYLDLTDLSAANRTGRYWKFSAIPRFSASNGQDHSHHISTFEFFDVSGNRLAISRYNLVDESRTNADFLMSTVNRVDFIQSANDAIGVAGFNGNVNLGGANGDTLTLTTGGNKFLGFQIGIIGTDAGLPVGTNQINSAGSNWPLNAMVGRFIRILTGTNAGNFYRVASVPTSTQVTVTTPSGSAVAWAGTESNIQFTVHEGINVGGVAPDYIRFADGRELTLATINDTLTTLTVAESGQPARTNVTWEIVRPGYDTSSTTTEATKTSRVVRPQSTYPVQSGDLCADSRGSYRFFSEDIGSGYQRADGVVPGGSGSFTGTNFTPDDVGRLLYITTGVNIGIYEISVYTSATSITVKNHYTGAAVSLTADAGPVTYQVFGDRRFRLAKLVVGLRA